MDRRSDSKCSCKVTECEVCPICGLKAGGQIHTRMGRFIDERMTVKRGDHYIDMEKSGVNLPEHRQVKSLYFWT